ncbi:MAG TPA: hypothetical protein VFX59_29860 [Polyangiales bacterium]|nr:hypothetical protein [Polyangiales bacterium]
MTDPVVRIYAEDEYAIVQVDLGYVGKFTFRYNALTPWAAVLLTQRINQRLP